MSSLDPGRALVQMVEVENVQDISMRRAGVAETELKPPEQPNL